MKFAATHISFSNVEEGWVLALADSVDGMGPTHIMLSFAENEDEQDRALGLTGLFLATKPEGPRGYGLIKRVDYVDGTLTVVGETGFEAIEVQIATDMMSSIDLGAAVDRCNLANASRPDKSREVR